MIFFRKEDGNNWVKLPCSGQEAHDELYPGPLAALPTQSILMPRPPVANTANNLNGA